MNLQTIAAKAIEVRRVAKLRKDTKLASLGDVAEAAYAFIQEVERHESEHGGSLIDMASYMAVSQFADRYYQP